MPDRHPVRAYSNAPRATVAARAATFFAEVVEAAVMWRLLVAAYARGEMQYRVSFLFRVLGSFIVTIIDFAAVAVLLSRIPHLAGWSFGEVALLYGMAAVCFAIAEMLAGSLDFFDTFIQAGTFDRLLTRPLGLLVQAMAEGFSLRRLGRAGQGAVVIVIAFGSLDLTWTLGKTFVLALALISGTALYFAIFVLTAVFCFWTVQGKEATHVFTYGGEFMSMYPLEVYDGWLRRFVTFVIPLAFVNYYPALLILGRPDSLGLPPWLGYLSPLVALAVALIARKAWQIGISQYQSTGT